MENQAVKKSLFEQIKSLTRKITDNPVLMKELQIGLREKKVFLIQIVYMLVIGIVTFFYMLEVANRTSYQAMQEAGRGFFTALCIVQWILVVLISPSLTSTAISSEREKKTLEMLLVSLLGASEIITGKLAYAISYIFLLLTSSLPLVALVFFLGGVSPLEILVNYTALLLWGTLVCMMALFFSSRESRSATATNSAYGVLVIGGLFTASLYLPLVAESGLMLNFQTKFPEILGWLALYFNILWGFLFFFNKTANNIRPRASHILHLHTLFIIGFLVNLAGFLALVTSSTNLGGSSSAGAWAFIISSCFFFMGCFIERHRFISNREEGVLSKSITSKPYFFPAYFGIVVVIFTLFMTLMDSDTIGANIVSISIFAAVLLSLMTVTREIYRLFNGKIRPVLIYYSFLLLFNIVPLFSWLIIDAIRHNSGDGLSFFSFIFVQPIFAVYSIWDPAGDFGIINFIGMKLPMGIFTLGFYVVLGFGAKILGTLIQGARSGSTGQTRLPPPDAESKI